MNSQTDLATNLAALQVQIEALRATRPNLPAETHQVLQNLDAIAGQIQHELATDCLTTIPAQKYLDVAEVILLGLDTEGNIQALNRKGQAVLGYDACELIGQNWFEVCLPPENRDEVRALFAQITAGAVTGESYAENWVLTQSGEKRLISWHNTALTDPTGNISGIISSGEDITDLKQTQEALHVSLEKYRVIFESFPLAITVTDAAGKIIETNREAERLLGLPAGEHTLRNIDDPEWQIVRPDGSPMPPEEYASVRALNENRLVENVEMGVWRPDGPTVWINVTAAPIPLPNYGVAITYGDITRRKQAESDFEREHKLLIKMMDTSPSAITLVNKQGEITYANQKAEEVLGLTRSQMLLLRYNAPEWQITDFEGNPFPEDQLPFVQVLKTGQPALDVRHAIQRKDGRRVLLSINAAPLSENEEGVESVISAISDITEQVYAEQRRIGQVAEELKSLTMLSPLPQTAITAQIYGSQPLRMRQPKTFAELVETYRELLDAALENRVYRTQHDLPTRLRALADALGNLHAGPRDLIDMHASALKSIRQNSRAARAEAYALEGRIVALEAMGYLAAYYRDRLSAARSLIISGTEQP